MNSNEIKQAPPKFGGWRDAEDLRRWSFLQRSPQQRLDWLVDALSIAYRSGALKTPAEIITNPSHRQTGAPRPGERRGDENHADDPQAREPHAGEPHAGEPQAGEPHSGEPQVGVAWR